MTIERSYTSRQKIDKHIWNQINKMYVAKGDLFVCW